MNRITILAAAGVLVATPAIGAWAAFGATDDNPSRTSNVRVDDRGRHGEAEPGDDHGRDGHGADDPAGDVRRSGEPEPGDDNGGHDEREPGDDHGGNSGPGGGDDDPGHH
jgi:hypothetical protein